MLAGACYRCHVTGEQPPDWSVGSQPPSVDPSSTDDPGTERQEKWPGSRAGISLSLVHILVCVYSPYF